MQQKEKESHFLEQLLDPHKIDDYQLPIPINAELRKYQKVCWIYSPALRAICHSHLLQQYTWFSVERDFYKIIYIFDNFE